jgi:hypothetical protein
VEIRQSSQHKQPGTVGGGKAADAEICGFGGRLLLMPINISMPWDLKDHMWYNVWSYNSPEDYNRG